MTTPEELLTSREAADRKGVTIQAIYKAIERGELPFTRVHERIVIRALDVEAYQPHNYGGRSRKDRILLRQAEVAPGALNVNAPDFEATLWLAADKMRGSLDAAEYKSVVLGLIFLKYISESFEERHEALLEAAVDPASEDYYEAYVHEEKARYAFAEERDHYTVAHIFYVPPEARWRTLAGKARQPEIGQIIDDAMTAIERENPRLKGILPKEFARPSLDPRRLGALIDLLGTIGLGKESQRSQDILGRVYEYFLGRFASAEGKRGGEFFTPRPVVKMLVEMLAPYKGKVYDPCCGSGGMFVQSEKFVQSHGGRINDLSVYGQELNANTWKLAKMNLEIRGIESNLGKRHADTFHDDLHPDLKANFILANPPFNISDWGGDQLRDDRRWKFGGVPPPVSNANYAWIEHIISHLAPGGFAGFVMANGSLSAATGGEDKIRRGIVDGDLVDCIVSLPGQLFYTTPIPVCLWFLTRSKRDGKLRDRRDETLFIDARKLGVMESRVLKTLTDDDISRIAQVYHAWRGDADAEEYADIPGFCKSVTGDEIARHDHKLTPGRYVGAADVEEDADAEPFADALARLTQTLTAQFAESARLEAVVQSQLGRITDAR
jgi:type I restriction enzyme M protein